MFNNFLKNKMLPWQEHGRWYRLVAVIEKVSSSVYAWAIDTDRSDPIFSDPNGFIPGTSTTTYIPLTNSTGVKHQLLDIHRTVLNATDIAAITLTQSTSAPVAALIPANNTVNVYIGATSNAANYTSQTEVEIYLFIE